MYQYLVKFVPKDTSPKKASAIISVEFSHKNLSKSVAHKQAYKSSQVDSYSLRNHWEIFEIDVKYDNAPWDSFEELVASLMRYDIANNWKYVGRKLYVFVEDGCEKEYITKVSSYYSPLNPRVSTEGVIKVDVKPSI